MSILPSVSAARTKRSAPGSEDPSTEDESGWEPSQRGGGGSLEASPWRRPSIQRETRPARRSAGISDPVDTAVFLSRKMVCRSRAN